MKISGVLETCLYVDDLVAAEAFYGKVLNLTSFSRVKDRHIFFKCGASMLLLFNPAQTIKPGGDVPAHGAHGPGHIAFAVPADQIPAWRAHLQQAGIQIETEITWPSGGQSIYFRDPAGNSLEIATTQVWE